MVGLLDFKPKSKLVVEEHTITRAKFPLIDIHTHWGWMWLGETYAEQYTAAPQIEAFKQYNVERVVNLDLFCGEKSEKMLAHIGNTDFIIHFCNLECKKVFEPGFETYVYNSLKTAVAQGCKGIKMWKNITLSPGGKDPLTLPPDDKRLACIYAYAAEFGLPILQHIADPLAFFDPIDEYNERYEELGVHPEWWFGDSGYQFEQLMDMQRNTIGNNPKTTFIIAHCGSRGEDLSWVAKELDTFPNMNIDTAERISELGRQPFTAKKFFEKYQDRIFFGSDNHPMRHYSYPVNFRTFETNDEYFNYNPEPDSMPNQGRWMIYGLGLSDDILKKFYHDNAAKLLGLPLL